MSIPTRQQRPTLIIRLLSTLQRGLAHLASPTYRLLKRLLKRIGDAEKRLVMRQTQEWANQDKHLANQEKQLATIDNP